MRQCMVLAALLLCMATPAEVEAFKVVTGPGGAVQPAVTGSAARHVSPPQSHACRVSPCSMAAEDEGAAAPKPSLPVTSGWDANGDLEVNGAQPVAIAEAKAETEAEAEAEADTSAEAEPEAKVEAKEKTKEEPKVEVKLAESKAPKAPEAKKEEPTNYFDSLNPFAYIQVVDGPAAKKKPAPAPKKPAAAPRPAAKAPAPAPAAEPKAAAAAAPAAERKVEKDEAPKKPLPSGTTVVKFAKAAGDSGPKSSTPEPAAERPKATKPQPPAAPKADAAKPAAKAPKPADPMGGVLDFFKLGGSGTKAPPAKPVASKSPAKTPTEVVEQKGLNEVTLKEDLKDMGAAAKKAPAATKKPAPAAAKKAAPAAAKKAPAPKKDDKVVEVSFGTITDQFAFPKRGGAEIVKAAKKKPTPAPAPAPTAEEVTPAPEPVAPKPKPAPKAAPKPASPFGNMFGAPAPQAKAPAPEPAPAPAPAAPKPAPKPASPFGSMFGAPAPKAKAPTPEPAPAPAPPAPKPAPASPFGNMFGAPAPAPKAKAPEPAPAPAPAPAPSPFGGLFGSVGPAPKKTEEVVEPAPAPTPAPKPSAFGNMFGAPKPKPAPAPVEPPQPSPAPSGGLFSSMFPAIDKPTATKPPGQTMPRPQAGKPAAKPAVKAEAKPAKASAPSPFGNMFGAPKPAPAPPAPAPTPAPKQRSMFDFGTGTSKPAPAPAPVPEPKAPAPSPFGSLFGAPKEPKKAVATKKGAPTAAAGRSQQMDASFLRTVSKLLQSNQDKIKKFQVATDRFRGGFVTAKVYLDNVEKLFGAANVSKVIEPLLANLPEKDKKKSLQDAYKAMQKASPFTLTFARRKLGAPKYKVLIEKTESYSKGKLNAKTYYTALEELFGAKGVGAVVPQIADELPAAKQRALRSVATAQAKQNKK